MANVRAMYMLGLLQQHIPVGLRYSVSKDDVCKDASASVYEVERVCGLMRDDAIDPRGINAVLQRMDEFDECSKRWTAEWDIVRPQLEVWKRCEQLPDPPAN